MNKIRCKFNCCLLFVSIFCFWIFSGGSGYKFCLFAFTVKTWPVRRSSCPDNRTEPARWPHSCQRVLEVRSGRDDRDGGTVAYFRQRALQPAAKDLRPSSARTSPSGIIWAASAGCCSLAGCLLQMNWALNYHRPRPLRPPRPRPFRPHWARQLSQIRHWHEPVSPSTWPWQYWGCCSHWTTHRCWTHGIRSGCHCFRNHSWPYHHRHRLRHQLHCWWYCSRWSPLRWTPRIHLRHLHRPLRRCPRPSRPCRRQCPRHWRWRCSHIRRRHRTMMVMRSGDSCSGGALRGRGSRGSSSAAGRDSWPDCPSCPTRRPTGRSRL